MNAVKVNLLRTSPRVVRPIYACGHRSGYNERIDLETQIGMGEFGPVHAYLVTGNNASTQVP